MTALIPSIGYDVAAEVSKEAYATGKSLKEIILERGLMDEDAIDKALDLRPMTEGGLTAGGGE